MTIDQSVLTGLPPTEEYEEKNGTPIRASINGHEPSFRHSSFSEYLNGHCCDEFSNIQREPDGSSQAAEMTNGHSINQEAIDASEDVVQPPIAICGLALRLPAGLKMPQQLWEFLLAGGDARGRVPGSRYNVASFHDATGKYGTVFTEYGYFLDEDIGTLDTSFFSMPRMEVERTDPQQRLMLEVARECFEDAGETSWRGKCIGCYMGSLGEDWCEMFARETQNWGPYRYTGFGDFALSNRVSYEMDLQGPRFVSDRGWYCSILIFHQYDYANRVLIFACSPSRSLRGDLKRRLPVCHCWRREFDNDARSNNEYDGAKCVV